MQYSQQHQHVPSVEGGGTQISNPQSGQSNSARIAQMQQSSMSPMSPMPGMAGFTPDGYERMLQRKKAQEERAKTPTPLDEFLPLSQGTRGKGAKLLQTRLNELGANLVTDGDFGAKTASALNIFQIANNLQRSSTVDKNQAITMYSAQAKSLKTAKLDGVPGMYLGEYDAYKKGKHIGKIDVVELDGIKVAAKTAKAWKILKAAAAKDGIQLKLNSGFRTQSEQKHLYEKYGSPRAVAPGYSNHQHGQALDIDAANPQHERWLKANAPKYGWKNTVSFEPWHWEYFGQ